jgi:hypothetical protein
MFLVKRKDNVRWDFKVARFRFDVLSNNYLWEFKKVQFWFFITVFSYICSFRINIIYWFKKSNLNKETINKIDKILLKLERGKK